MLCQQHWWLALPHSSLFSSFEVYSSKASSWLSRSKGVLEGWPLFFPSSRFLDSIFSDPPFSCFPFCHFSQVSWFLSVRLKDPQPPSFMVLPPGFPEVPNPYSRVVGSQAFWSLFLHHWVADKDIPILVPCVSWHAPLNCLNPNLVLLRVPRIPGSWESLGILA